MLRQMLTLFHISCRHDVAEVAGLTSFSFGEEEESRYVMIFKKVRKLCFSSIFGVIMFGENVTGFHVVPWQEFAPSDEELEAYRNGEEWDPKLAEQRRRLKVRLDPPQCFK